MMYREWRTEDNKHMRPVMDDHAGSDYQCGMQGPAGRYVCTRPSGHYGTHEAGAMSESNEGYNNKVHKAVAVWTDA